MARFALGCTFSERERLEIVRHARHRWDGKKDRGVDRTVHKGESRVKLNAIGLSGEIAWARFFGVPFYQNPEQGGDHHRDGDLQLRSKGWVEVKTSRNPKQCKVHRSTGDRWQFLAFAHWDQDAKKISFIGMMPKVQVQSDTIPAEAFGSPAWTLTATIALPRPPAEVGLYCPWCIKERWPCSRSECEVALQKREKA